MDSNCPWISQQDAARPQESEWLYIALLQTAGSGALTLSALAKCSEGDWPRHAAGPRASWAASSTRPAVRCAARIAVLWCRRGRCGALILSHAWIGLAVGSASASEIGSSAQLLAVAAN
jgi:hypothetical protein